ncbi:MAG: hypothetical protein LCH99_07890 [Proteobacteria bacterium]|nr:hypothetical protein [Pseudomonadota bacterium]
MTDEKTISDVERELNEYLRVEAAPVAARALVAICNDPKAPKQAVSAAASTLLRASGHLKETADRGPNKEPHEMSAEDLQIAIDRLEHLAQKGRKDEMFD